MAVKPKLALIPSGVKASKVYSVLPSDGVGDFDFTRSGSATRINKDGLIETVASNVPRLNYPLIDGVVSGCPSLLLEPSRTNLVTYSEDFSNAAWVKSGTTLSSNSVISPDGTLNADEFSFTSTAFFARQIVSVSASTNYTFSFYAKKGSAIGVNFRVFDLSNSSQIAFVNYQDDLVDNQWVRIDYSFTTPSGCTSIFVAPITDSITTGNIYIWGAMLEQSSYSTSYIKSNGSQATRSAETCNNSGDANTFNDSEGVLMVEVSSLDDDLTVRRINITDGSFDNAIRLGFTSTSNQIIGVVASSGTQAVLTYTVNDINSFNRLVIKYKQNDFSLWVNGFKVDTDLIGTTPIGLNDISFDFVGTGNFYGNTKQIQYFDTALTDTDLEELTSWRSFNEMAQSQLYSVY